MVLVSDGDGLTAMEWRLKRAEHMWLKVYRFFERSVVR